MEAPGTMVTAAQGRAFGLVVVRDPHYIIPCLRRQIHAKLAELARLSTDAVWACTLLLVTPS
eukprot:2614252-Amphidinium_carterae.1